MLLPRIALFFLLNAHVRTVVVVANSNFRPGHHHRQHRYQENRLERQMKDNNAPEHKRQEQLFVSDASHIGGEEVVTVTNNGPDEQGGKSLSFGLVEQNTGPDDIHSKNPLDKKSGQGEESDQLSLHYSSSTSTSATNEQSFSSVSLPASSSSPSPSHPHRHRRHHHRQFSSGAPPLDQLVADPNNAQHSQLAMQEAIRRIVGIARKRARESNTEIPDLPGQSAAQKARLAADDYVEVGDSRESSVSSSDAAYNLAQQRLSSKFVPQLVILNQILRERRADSRRLS